MAMMLGGGGVFAASIISAIALGGADEIVGVGILGFIACFIGAIRANRFGLDWYVRETAGSETGWQQVYVPTGWAPRSADQLRAVEQLADDHGGKAFARPHPDGGTEVKTLKRGRLHTHLVADDGTVSLIHRSGLARLYVLGVAAMVLGAATGVVAIVLHNLSDLDAETVWYVSLGLFFAGTVPYGLVTLERTVQDRAAGGWHLVQTKPDDTD